MERFRELCTSYKENSLDVEKLKKHFAFRVMFQDQVNEDINQQTWENVKNNINREALDEHLCVADPVKGENPQYRGDCVLASDAGTNVEKNAIFVAHDHSAPTVFSALHENSHADWMRIFFEKRTTQ